MKANTLHNSQKYKTAISLNNCKGRECHLYLGIVSLENVWFEEEVEALINRNKIKQQVLLNKE